MNDLVAITLEVLERFAFMFGEPVPLDSLAADPNADLFCASIPFHGPHEGNLRILSDEDFCEELAANVVGGDREDMTPEIAADALRELVNILCGEVLHHFFGDRELYALGIPQLEKMTQERWNACLNGKDCAGLNVDGHNMIVGLSCTPPIQAFAGTP